MQTYVALLRGINVSGKNKVGMEPLRVMFTALGLRQVATYIQSGNVVFQSDAKSTTTLAADIQKAIAKKFALKIPVVIRTRAQLVETLAKNPFLAGAADTSRLFVVFLDAHPTAEAIATLDPKRSPPDELVVRGHDVYLHCPSGYGNTKLTIDYFERKLAATATARNWNTVAKLVEMSGG